MRRASEPNSHTTRTPETNLHMSKCAHDTVITLHISSHLYGSCAPHINHMEWPWRSAARSPCLSTCSHGLITLLLRSGWSSGQEKDSYACVRQAQGAPTPYLLIHGQPSKSKPRWCTVGAVSLSRWYTVDAVSLKFARGAVEPSSGALQGESLFRPPLEC